MENFYSHKIFLSFSILFYHFFHPSLQSSAYTRPDNYFINCGSNSDATVNGRTFISDVNPGSFTVNHRENSDVISNNPPADFSSDLYNTSRIFKKETSYELDIVEKGTYVVRFHFYPLTSQENVSIAKFNVSLSEFTLLSNFSVENSTKKIPNIQEFLLTLNGGRFRISFTPSRDSFAFVSAIEAFLAPVSLVPDSATHVTPKGREGNYSNLLSEVLHVIHRINVGGGVITADNDTLWRTWKPDDDYLLNPEKAKNKSKNGVAPNYKWATPYDAPDLVYNSAKEMNLSAGDWFNITWRFNVSKSVKHRARFHFSDIISETVNDYPTFNLSIYGKFTQLIDPYKETAQPLQAPFYHDFVVDSDDSGVINVTIGPRNDSHTKTAFLNGVEIMELLGNFSFNDSSKKSKSSIRIIAPVAGGFLFIVICVVVLIFALRRRKRKSVEKNDWSIMSVYGGVSYGGSTERTVNASPLPDFNLGLKLPFAHILYATKNFDKKLIIGEGGFGKVYKGILPNGVKVAVKRSEQGHGQGLPEFHTEINLLSRIRHQHLVSLIGYCDELSEMILVYEFVEKGTLRDHLYKSNEECDNRVAQSNFSWQQRVEICIGAARGLNYLHSGLDGPIIHRDVKSTNILLDGDYVAKVSDFGLSKSGLLDQTHVSTEVKGSFGYLDPEYFRCLQLTQKSDVYSFGVVLLEVLCARPAINNLLPREEVNLAEWGLFWQKKGEIEKIVDPLLVGTIHPSSLRIFGETIEKCLEEYGIDRPNMVDVLWNLEYVLKLQLPTIARQPYDNSITDVSVELPLHVLNRLPSHNIQNSETQVFLSTEDMESSYTDASNVFSQLKINEAR